ncbi:hypothetical protein ACOSQ4_024204 [Xanthoceras sorbifolium]
MDGLFGIRLGSEKNWYGVLQVCRGGGTTKFIKCCYLLSDSRRRGSYDRVIGCNQPNKRTNPSSGFVQNPASSSSSRFGQNTKSTPPSASRINPVPHLQDFTRTLIRHHQDSGRNIDLPYQHCRHLDLVVTRTFTSSFGFGQNPISESSSLSFGFKFGHNPSSTLSFGFGFGQNPNSVSSSSSFEFNFGQNPSSTSSFRF